MEFSSVASRQVDTNQQSLLSNQEAGLETGKVEKVKNEAFTNIIPVRVVEKNLEVSRSGRVRGTELPPEVMLALFIRDVENKHSSWRDEIPINEWHGVTCSESGEVTSIRWESMKLKGALNWDCLPSSLKEVVLFDNNLDGEIKFSSLPLNLERFEIGWNTFYGVFEVNKLPTTLEVLQLFPVKF